MILASDLLAASLALPQETRGTSPASRPTRIRAGESARAILVPRDPDPTSPDGTRAFEFLAESSGPVTIPLETFDYDAFLRFASPSGEFALSLSPGVVDRPSGGALLDAAASQGGAAERALARGDKCEALKHRLRELDHRFNRADDEST